MLRGDPGPGKNPRLMLRGAHITGHFLICVSSGPGSLNGDINIVFAPAAISVLALLAERVVGQCGALVTQNRVRPPVSTPRSAS